MYIFFLICKRSGGRHLKEIIFEARILSELESDSQRSNWNVDETRTRETLPASNTGLYRVNW